VLLWPFCFHSHVTLQLFKRVPVWIAIGVILVTCLAAWLRPDAFERPEWWSFDMRVRQALKSSPSVATNLGFVFIDEESLVYVRTNRTLGFNFAFPWPRQVYGRLAHELASQGAKAVALDIVLAELRQEHDQVQMADGRLLDSDEFFALQLRRAGNVILAVSPRTMLPALFRTNAIALGDVSADADKDAILRRARAFRYYRKWHPAFQQVEADPELGVDLTQARIERDQIVLVRHGAEDIKVPLDAGGNFDLADFVGDKIPPGVQRHAKPFTEERIWHMGIVLASIQLGLDLAHPEIDYLHDTITLRGPGGMKRTLPVDSDGYFYIDWCLPPNDPHLALEPIQGVLAQSVARLKGQTNHLSEQWQGKLVVVGSAQLVGNNVTDRGGTPLGPNSLLVSKHWNVANSIITGRFIRRAPLSVELALIVLLGVLAAVLTWRVRVLVASGLIILVIVAYVAFGVWLFVETRYWIPLVLPVTGALIMNHVFLVTWRVVFEQAKGRRIKAIFSGVVSPKIVSELLEADSLSLGGARREVTVLFADVRGFTAFTDASQERVDDRIRKKQLRGAAAKVLSDETARETLETINLYLGLLADILIKQDGTLDKFIGDCVMAFWGAPTSNPKHAAACVRAAIDAQRAIYALNQQRAAENRKIEFENLARAAAGQEPKALLPLLLLGTGINTGMATVGLMGSQAQQKNYTVFGREVNLASRLESASGRGHIFIGETTYAHLLRDDPELGATCIALPAQQLKGFVAAVKAYEVPWRPSGSQSLDDEFATGAPDTSSVTGFIQHGGT
jgi:class 3 adenylate cyclase/CHASE2 domain-containing sensor protein